MTLSIEQALDVIEGWSEITVKRKEDEVTFQTSNSRANIARDKVADVRAAIKTTEEDVGLENSNISFEIKRDVTRVLDSDMLDIPTPLRTFINSEPNPSLVISESGSIHMVYPDKADLFSN